MLAKLDLKPLNAVFPLIEAVRAYEVPQKRDDDGKIMIQP